MHPMPRTKVVELPLVPSLSGEDCRLLVESVVGYAIFMLSPDGYVATWSAGARQMNGYDAGEVIGRHFSVFYLPEDVTARKPAALLASAARDGRVEDEGWRVRKDGSRFWASVVITARRDELGRLRGYGAVTQDVTARRTAEAQLHTSEQRFHHLIDAVVDYAIFMIDPAGNITTWNTGAARLKGYSEPEIIGRHFSTFHTPEDRAAGRPAHILAAALRHGRVDEEGWRVRKDGSRFWAHDVITALRDDQGELIGFAKVTRDLTERRAAEEERRRSDAKDRQLVREQTAREVAEQAERRVRESEERYRALSRRLEIVFEGVDDGISVQDRSGAVVFANAAAARMCGFERAEDFIAAAPESIVVRYEVLDEHGRPFDAEALPARRVLAGMPSSSALMNVRERRSTRQWWTLVRASPVLDDAGEPELVINIWHDVTAERRQEIHAKHLADATAALTTSLRPAEMLDALGRTLVPGLGDWCSIFLLEGDELKSVCVAHADPARRAADAERFPLRSSEEGGLWEVVRSGRPAVVNDVSEELTATATPGSEHLALLRGAGMKAVAMVPIHHRDRTLGALALVFAEREHRYDTHDVELAQEIARRAAVALESAELYAAAERAAKNAESAARSAEDANRAKDEFLATVSHELRTPLSAILGWSALLRQRVIDPALLKPIDVIHRNAQAQVKIIDDILDVSRVINGKLRLEVKPVDLVAIAKDAAEVVRPSADAKGILLELTTGDKPCLLVADPERMQQVVWNLLSNAVKFSDSGAVVRLGIEQRGPLVELEVSDTGRGIDPAFLPMMFERFKQADSSKTRRVGGLGLGLAIVRHIVELHGGRVRAASDGPGKGATFTITLPVRAVAPARAEPPPSPLRPQAPPRTGADLRGVRVLVVDDEPDARELVAVVLGDAGSEVEIARSAAEGFEAFRRFRPDVLVSDVGMPDEDGYSFIRRVRALSTSDGGRIPSLALSAFTREEDRAQALRAGYTAHLGKPADPEVLTTAVANLAGVRQRASW
jgi:PAS domain S-box-containing protein